MEAITLWQPWASLVACGAKRYETRGWATNYRGPIAIHAGIKRIDDQSLYPLFDRALQEHQKLRTPIPYGAIIATAELVECWEIEKHPVADRPVLGMRGGDNKITTDELLFGDWTPGRYAWELANVQMLPEPIPAKGKQGLWNWEGVL